MVDGGGLENRWVNSPGGSNPSLSELLSNCINLVPRVRIPPSPNKKDAMTKENFFTKVSFLAYFPFLGWLLTAIIKKDDEFIIFHSKQGFILATYMAIFSSLVFIVSGLIDTAMVRLGLVVLIYLNYAVYLFLCIWGTFYIITGKRKNLPFTAQYMNRFEL